MSINSATSFAMADPRRQSNFFPVAEPMGPGHLGYDFLGAPQYSEKPAYSDDFYSNEMFHAGLQLPRVFRNHENPFYGSLGPGGCGLEKPYDTRYNETPDTSALVSPNVRFSSNLLDTPYNGLGSLTAPTSTTVTPRSSVAPKELPDVNLRNRDFIREHFARDQVNREYTFRDHSPLGGRDMRNSFSLGSVPGPRMDVNKLNQLMHSLQLGEPRLMDPFKDAGHEPLAPLSNRSSIWSTGGGSQPPGLQNYSHKQHQHINISPPTPVSSLSSMASQPAAAPRLRFLSSSAAIPAYHDFQAQVPDYERAKRNLYAEKLNNPVFVPTDQKPQPTRPAEEPREVSEKRPASRKPLDGSVKNDTKRKKPALQSNIVVDFGNLAKQPVPAIAPASLNPHGSLGKECSRYVLESCTLKDYPEDFCSTFYKRNTHGYMFIRELSNSLKVNASGPKSWVTLKVKLGEVEQQKLKVDVKRLPVWKPINLNQPHTLRKAVRRRKPLKKPTNRRR